MKTWSFGYEKSKARAKQSYSAIGRVPCPALGGELVVFNSAGFNHLVRKGRIPRTRNEQKKRFVLVPYIEQIIRNPTAIILYQRRETRIIINRHGERVLLKSAADFWTFIEKIDKCQVKVVVRQLESGEKHFLSVMGDKVHIDNRKRKKRR